MAIAWSRISSKVIVDPPYADEACSRRGGNWQGRLDVCIPQMAARRKPEVLGARDAAVTPLSQPRGRMCHVCVDILHPAEPSRSTGAHHVPKHTMHEKTRQSQQASLPQSPGAPRT